MYTIILNQNPTVFQIMHLINFGNLIRMISPTGWTCVRSRSRRTVVVLDRKILGHMISSQILNFLAWEGGFPIEIPSSTSHQHDHDSQQDLEFDTPIFSFFLFPFVSNTFLCTSFFSHNILKSIPTIMLPNE